MVKVPLDTYRKYDLCIITWVIFDLQWWNFTHRLLIMKEDLHWFCVKRSKVKISSLHIWKTWLPHHNLQWWNSDHRMQMSIGGSLLILWTIGQGPQCNDFGSESKVDPLNLPLSQKCHKSHFHSNRCCSVQHNCCGVVGIRPCRIVLVWIFFGVTIWNNGDVITCHWSMVCFCIRVTVEGLLFAWRTATGTWQVTISFI